MNTATTSIRGQAGVTAPDRQDVSDLLYLTSLILPAATGAFLVVPAYQPHLAGVWLAALVSFGLIDRHADPIERTPPAASARRWPFMALLLTLATLQLANFLLLAIRVQSWGLFSLQTVVATVLLGVGSAFTSVVVAHELIHRHGWFTRALGRVLLWTLLYDHFFTEHLRGHHKRVAAGADPLIARHEESFWGFAARSGPGELLSAWTIARRRSSSYARNEFVHGAVAEGVIAIGLFVAFGGASLLVFLMQAAVAHLLIAAVNYIEHWGLLRSPRPDAPSAWDSAAPASHYTLLGLPFHADHHEKASKSFERLALHEASPKLPYGYFTMVALVIFSNRNVRALLERELEQKGFAPALHGIDTRTGANSHTAAG